MCHTHMHLFICYVKAVLASTSIVIYPSLQRCHHNRGLLNVTMLYSGYTNSSLNPLHHLGRLLSKKMFS
jgi:hypothetical protein